MRLYNSDLGLTFQTCNKAPSSKKHKSFFFLLSIHLLFTILIISTCVGFVLLCSDYISYVDLLLFGMDRGMSCLITHFILIYNPQFNYVRA